MREVGGSTAVEAIVPFADHESWQVRAELAESLGKIDDDDLSSKANSVRVSAIIELMSDKDSFVVVKASEAMPSTKDRDLIAKLADIAGQKPDIAEKIIESLAPNSYDDDAIDVSKFMLEFLDNEHAQVRRGGLKGLQSSYESKLDDEVLAKVIQDPDEKNRILGMSAFVNRLASIRPGATEEYNAEVQRYNRIRSAPKPSLLSRLFGMGSSSEPAQPMIEEFDMEDVPLDSVELAEPTEEEGQEAGGAEESNAEPTESVDGPTDSETEPASDQPELEQWLAKFVSGKVKDTEFVKASQAIKQALANATNEDEIFTAGVALAAYGESERIPGLIAAAKTEDMKRQLSGLLIWVPFDERVKLVDAIVTPETTKAELAMVVQSFSSVSNPQGAGVFWKLAEHPNVDLYSVYRSFYQLIFDGNESYYNPGRISEDNQKLAEQLVASVPPVEEMGDNQAMLALALLNHMDQPKAKELATTLAASDHSDQVKHLAARVQLRTDKFTVDQWGERKPSTDRSHAVEVLKSKDPVQLALALKYIAFGEDVLNQNAKGEMRFHIAAQSYMYGISNGRKRGSAKVFDPPDGMTEAMLDFKGVNLSEEGKAYATYFRTLFDEKADLKPLLDYHNQHTDNEQVNKLVYRAVAATNKDDLVGVVGEIYDFNKSENDNDSDHADLYWTIRPMDGDNAMELRKRIRDTEGLSNFEKLLTDINWWSSMTAWWL